MNRVATQPRNLPLAITPELCKNKTYIVTGANTGLGYEAAKHLVAAHASKVIIAVRSLSSGLEAKRSIDAATGTSTVTEVWELDLSSYASVKAFAQKAQGLERIDALIENAGVASGEKVFAEGHLVNITVNTLSTMLLAVLLLPKLAADAKKYGNTPHVAVVASGTAFDMESAWGEVRDDPLAKIDNLEMPLRSYPLSKLLVVLAVRRLAALAPVSRTGVVVNIVDPGLCITTLSKDAPQTFKDQIKQQHEQYGRTPEDGSRTLLFGAVAGKESHGCFTESCRIAEDWVPSWVDAESLEVAWDAISRELEKAVPGCTKEISTL